MKITFIPLQLLLLLSLFVEITILAQPPGYNPGLIQGRVVDNSSGASLEYATISLHRVDSSLVTGTITDNSGNFEIETRPGKYYIHIQFISYQDFFIDNIHLSKQNKLQNLGIINLQPASTNLDAVSITGEKSEMIISLDKKIFNVGKDLSNTGNNALDILDNIPSVTVDLDGNINLRGSSAIQILVDGKPSGMATSDNPEALRSMQGSMIDYIEVITNPSARHEAEGMAGIINIVLKKNQQKGFNGSFELTAGYPHTYSAGTFINLRRNKTNYFLNYTLRYNERPGGGFSYQTFNREDTSYHTDVEKERLRKGLSNRIRGGLDYYISPSSTLTGAIIAAYDIQKNTSVVDYTDYAINSDLNYAFSERVDREAEDELDFELTLNYEKKFLGKDHKLNAFAHYISNTEVEDSDIEENIEAYIPLQFDSLINQQSLNKEGETRKLLQADYTKPFGNKGKIEAGVRSEFREIENSYAVEETLLGNWEKIPELSNDFDYSENINAAYFQAENTFNRFALQGGLRAEYSFIKTHLHDTDERDTRNYFDLFPSINTSYQFTKTSSAQIGYSRRIRRPHFRMLNPFHSYSDSRNLRTGNPDLKPQYTHSTEAGYLLNLDKYNFYAGAYYRYSTNVFDRIVYLDSAGISIVRPENLNTRQSFGFETSSTLNISEWWTLNANLDIYRVQTEGEIENQLSNSDDYSWNVRVNSRIKLPKKTNIQTIFFYRAPQETLQGLRKAMYMLNFAVSKEVLKGKGTLTFNVQDILNSRRFRYTLNSPSLHSEMEYYRSERTYKLTFAYRLNQDKRMKQGSTNERNGDSGDDDMDF